MWKGLFGVYGVFGEGRGVFGEGVGVSGGGEILFVVIRCSLWFVVVLVLVVSFEVIDDCGVDFDIFFMFFVGGCSVCVVVVVVGSWVGVLGVEWY